MNDKQSGDPNIARGRVLIEETQRHAKAMWQEVVRSRKLLKETRELLDATKPKRNTPDAS